MRLDLKFKEDSIEEVRKKNQEQKKELVYVNSIEPKTGHSLFTFQLSECGTFFHTSIEDFKTEKELIFVRTKNGSFVEKKEEREKVVIDIFNPDFKASKKRYNKELKQGVGYITALNYKNAVKKFKELNPNFFR